MTYIVVMLQTIALVLIIIAIIYSKEEQKLREELIELYDKIIENNEKEYKHLYEKYKKLLDFKYNVRLIILNAEANKEIFAETVEKIKRELDESDKHI